MKVEIKLEGFAAVEASLRALPAEVSGKNGGPARVALRRGGVILYREVMARLSVSLSRAGKTGKNYQTGLLFKNVKLQRGKPPPGQLGEVQNIRVRRVMNRTGAGAISTTREAAALEVGTSKQHAEPFALPAFMTKAELAIRTVEKEMGPAVERAWKKLNRQNAGKK